ncbi:MAG: WYL domain-containing protein [Clostridia bacterium]|nr:WYL domain-containing protein [Clostridia bacterium]
MSTAAEKSFNVLRILNEHSDEDHPLNATEICTYLAQSGIETERRSIYRSIQGLDQAGYDIVKAGKDGWFIGRKLETVEVKILMDAVQQAHFLTYNKSNELIGKLLGLTSKNIAAELKKQVSLSNRPKHDNESIYYNIDKINTCIVKNKKLSFSYFDYDTKGNRVFRKENCKYTTNPYFTTWYNENYYMIAATNNYSNFSHYRIERMTDLEIINQPRRNISELAPNGFDLADYLNKAFSMFTGKPETIRLKIKNTMANQVFDRFGINMLLAPADDEHSYLRTDAVIDKGLVSWIISYRNNIEVIQPDKLKQEIVAHCREVLGMYKE